MTRGTSSGKSFCSGQGPGGGYSELLGGVEAPFSTGTGDTGGAAMMEVHHLEGRVSSMETEFRVAESLAT